MSLLTINMYMATKQIRVGVKRSSPMSEDFTREVTLPLDIAPVEDEAENGDEFEDDEDIDVEEDTVE